MGYAANRLCAETLRDDPRFLGTCLLLPVLPDVDALAFRWIPYEHLLGHRGLTHSLLFALLCGVAGAGFCSEARERFRGGRWGLTGFLFLLTASHGCLDALTTGGLGIAFLSPLDPTRFWLAPRLIPAAPISPTELFSRYVAGLLLIELLLIGAPAAGVCLLRTRRGRWRIPLAMVLFCLSGAAWVAGR